MNPNQPSYPPPPYDDKNQPPHSQHPPAGAGYPPPHPQYPPTGPGYPPPHPQYPPTGSSYPPPHPQYPPVGSGYPPPNPQYAPTGPGYAPSFPQYAPVTQQPTIGVHQPTDGWAPMAAAVPANCPPGLQYLTTVDQLLVKQKVELLEAIIGFETNNKYTIKNSQGQKVYYAVEENDCCTRNCCGPMRSFDLKVLDNYKNEVISFHRDLACDSCWFPCCLQKLEVFAPPGCLVGSVEQTWSICTPEFDVKNESGHTVLKIEGPICRYGICGDIEFKVLSRDKSCVVGKISKQWSGLAREIFTDADHFGISFPLDLDVRMKAVMLGACFLIDFMYFEKAGNREDDGVGLL